MAEGGALLRRYGGELLHRGFESLLLRQYAGLAVMATATAAAAEDGREADEDGGREEHPGEHEALLGCGRFVSRGPAFERRESILPHPWMMPVPAVSNSGAPRRLARTRNANRA